jgi:hypothetical protein
MQQLYSECTRSLSSYDSIMQPESCEKRAMRVWAISNTTPAGVAQTVPENKFHETSFSDQETVLFALLVTMPIRALCLKASENGSALRPWHGHQTVGPPATYLFF